MGKRKRDKRMKNLNLGASREGESSAPTPAPSSSLRRSLRKNKASTDSTQGAAKKAKKNNYEEDSSHSKCKGQGQGQAGQRSRVKKASMNNLPSEMLTKILKLVDTSSLFHCRLVSRQWSAISSGILNTRTDVQVSFDFISRNLFVRRHGQLPSWLRGSKGDGLDDFLKCMKKSKSHFFCPFFAFAIDSFSPQSKFFDQPHFKKFITDFTASSKQKQNQNQNKRIKIKGLKFTFPWLFERTECHILAEKLGRLLLKKNLLVEQLALNFRSSVLAPQAKLFPTPTRTEINVHLASVPVSVPVQFQLPHLKVVHFETQMLPDYTGIFTDLLSAAVNLTRIGLSVHQLKDFHFLHSLGKLHLLKEADVEMDQEFFPILRNDPNLAPLSLPWPKLESLHLMVNEADKDHEFLTRAEILLKNLFESSKDTLTHMTIQPLGFFTGLQFPILKSLKKLTIQQKLNENETSRQRIFPPGVRSRNVFPAVSNLELDMYNWHRGFPQQDSIPVLPSVKTFILTNSRIPAGGIAKLALLCPNLKRLHIKKEVGLAPQLNFVLVGRSIWTHMKQLESLEVDVDFDEPENNSTVALDSCFTGISNKNCQRIADLKEADKLLRKWRYPTEILGLDLTANREHSSILDMKDLRTLIINPYAGDKLLERKEFLKQLTWISQEYALKFMPHLQINC